MFENKENKNLEVLITDTTVEGEGIARLDNKVYFVSKAVPQDKLLINVVKKRKNYFEAKIEKIIEPSPFRTNPICKHFGICGGCKWQHMNYQGQLIYKEKQVINQFERIGKINAKRLDICPSSDIFFYRNKLEFTFSTNKWYTDVDKNKSPVLGYHIPNRFDKVLDINECFLQPEPSNKIRNLIRKIALENNIPFYNSKIHEGFLRNLIIRSNSQNNFMLILSVTHYNEELLIPILSAIKTHFPEVESLYVAINNKLNDSLEGVELKLIYGNTYLYEFIDDLKFEVGPKSFMQVNYNQAVKLYKTAIEWAELSGNELVYDLYCGIGTISLLFAKKVKYVIGIEYIDEAVDNANNNAKINNITNAKFFSGDVKELLNKSELLSYGKPDLMIIDPPRSGMHPDVIKQILKILPEKIIYISCNAATQARDISQMLGKYQVIKYQPFDMFPQTAHVENIALLKKY